jgi:O-acetyl-ADP-ribose deacetylase (regulator of RNase III)
MIKYRIGNIINSESEAIVNTVNLYGIMGKGIALAFKKAFPLNFRLYKKACENKDIAIGKLFVSDTGEIHPKYIINFPTKNHWRHPSKYEYIEEGMKDLVRIIKEYDIKSIAIPPLGSGNGKLEWQKVSTIIEDYLHSIEYFVDITIYQPGFQDNPVTHNKDIPLTEARAIFIYILWHYQILGYEVNLLVAQKAAYFLQRFGAKLNLQFEKGTYGPYAHKLNHLLKFINGCYINYNPNRIAPNTEIKINKEKMGLVESYFNESLLESDRQNTRNVLDFIEGFESPYGLELLATIDFIEQQTGKYTFEDISQEIGNWTQRKSNIMKSSHIKIALERIRKFDLLFTPSPIS